MNIQRILFYLGAACLAAALLISVTACAEGIDNSGQVAAQPSPSPSSSASARQQPNTDQDERARLAEALSRYESIEAEGGWPTLPPGDVLEAGDTSAQVPTLRKRLAATGDLPAALASAEDSVYSRELAGALAAFQKRHGIVSDSLVGPNTREQLNISVEQRIAQIEASLDRWDELPDTLGSRYVLVNLPEFKLRAFENGDEVLQMAVIVGKEYDGRSTPVFSDSMEYVIFRPYWNIPPSIANEEILPKARGNRSYLVENDYEIVSHYGPDATVYDTYSTSLDRVASGELRLRQESGPSNALGLVKFMFPNDLAIYLHDTPADHLFDKVERDFSHGCIRVERPVDLAVWVLQDKPEWTRDRVQRAMQEGDWQRVDLDEEIPVHLVYQTVFVDEDGTVHFREDIYDLVETA